jgi:hypothetical protein
MCRKHEYDSSTVQGVREDMIDTDGATGRRFLLDYVWIPPYAMFLFLSNGIVVVCAADKKKVSLRPAQRSYFQLSVGGRDRLCSLSSSYTMWHIFGILLNYSKQKTHSSHRYEDTKAEV